MIICNEYMEMGNAYRYLLIMLDFYSQPIRVFVMCNL